MLGTNRTKRSNKMLARRVGVVAVVAAAAAALGVATPTVSGAGQMSPSTTGYWLLTSNGGVFDFNTPFLGAPASDPARCPVSPLPGRDSQPNGTCGSMAATPNGNGYWVMNSLTGAIYRYGNAHDFGSPKSKFAGTSPEFLPVMRQIVATPDGKGYWVYEVGASGMGAVDHYGDAGFFGDTTTLVQHHRVDCYNGLPVLAGE